jgi:hypothetical protein
MAFGTSKNNKSIMPCFKDGFFSYCPLRAVGIPAMRQSLIAGMPVADRSVVQSPFAITFLAPSPLP